MDRGAFPRDEIAGTSSATAFRSRALGQAGPLSQWLYAAMCEARLAVELLETRHVRDAFKGNAGED